MEGETEGGEDEAELHALSLINLLCLAAAHESHDRIFFGSVFTNICKRLLVMFLQVNTWSCILGNLCIPLQSFSGIVKFTFMVVAYSLGCSYSNISIYLKFEVYMEFITIYGNVFGYIRRALLVISAFKELIRLIQGVDSIPP